MARAIPPLVADAPDRAAPTDRSGPRRFSRLTWIGAVLVGCLLLAVGLWWGLDGEPALTLADIDRAVEDGVEQAQQEQRDAPPDAATVYRAILPSLVTVTTGGGDADGEAAVGLGAGVVINAEGAILTALHVVEGSDRIRVRFADGTTASALVVGSETDTDIAVLAADRLPAVVVPAVMGGGARVGDAVFPVGNPLGLEGSLSAGVVSALDRSVRTESGTSMDGLIQFDAAVNPGNSGGPLLDRGGRVIGIVTGLVNPTRQPYFVGVGFAVPIETAGGAAGGPRR
jgi:S1-C subfamily serine protease